MGLAAVHAVLAQNRRGSNRPGRARASLREPCTGLRARHPWYNPTPDGELAEWLRTGLQIREYRFESDTRLQ